MRIGIIGTGGVARMLAGALTEKGHDVVLGSRDPEAALARDDVNRQTGTTLAGWAEQHPDVRLVTNEEAVRHAETVWNATSGTAAVGVLQAAAGTDGLDGTIVLDISNPIARSENGVTLEPIGTDSFAEQLQRAFPNARVVKALNTVTAAVMIDPGSLAGGDHTIPICGNDDEAKREVAGWLTDWFGWRDVLDIGDLTAARAQEAYLLFWLRLMQTTGSPIVSTKVVR
ncbi:MAG TPA: NAD(P)-binding domain-containing protein [Actinomycetota bacterium]|nr:NAD(P)-binding domain-containing protein [Actinomycetota bacterium]